MQAIVLVRVGHVVDRIQYAWTGMPADNLQILPTPQSFGGHAISGHLHRAKAHGCSPPERAFMFARGPVIGQGFHFSSIQKFSPANPSVGLMSLGERDWVASLEMVPTIMLNSFLNQMDNLT